MEQFVFAIGVQSFIRIVFRKGEELGMHKHDDRGHASLPILGEFLISNPAGKTLRLTDKDAPVQFDIGEWHNIRAETEGAVMLQIWG